MQLYDEICHKTRGSYYNPDRFSRLFRRVRGLSAGTKGRTGVGAQHQFFDWRCVSIGDDMKNEKLVVFGKRLKELRLAAKRTQPEMGKFLGCTVSNYQKMEYRNINSPVFNFLIMIGRTAQNSGHFCLVFPPLLSQGF